MRITIETASNGLILTEEMEPGEVSRYVFSDSPDFEDSGLQDLLYYLVDLLGVCNSRYAPKRIYIETRPGDKFDDGRDDEDACEDPTA